MVYPINSIGCSMELLFDPNYIIYKLFQLSLRGY